MADGIFICGTIPFNTITFLTCRTDGTDKSSGMKEMSLRAHTHGIVRSITSL